MRSEDEIKNRVKELKAIKTKDKDKKSLINLELKFLEWVLQEDNQ